MYICSNCAGHLKYDIKTKKLLCESCGSDFPVGRIDESKLFKKEDSSYSTTKQADDLYSTYVFSCPQCGGEIRNDNNEAASFCLYCGASNVLEGRLSDEKKPDYILPFSIDKEQCKEIYRKFAKKKIFAPSDFMTEGKAEGFRGIYMPYWIYNIEQKGKISLKGEKTRTKGDLKFYEEYALTGDLDARYEGLMYDASSSFYDDYSQCISPFDMKEAVLFDSSYLAGFYADTYDVGDNVYTEEALKIVNDITYNDHVKNSFKAVKPNTPKDLTQTLNSDAYDKKSALLPVWFMSVRYKDRMLYSAINGQTGEIASDIPISITKYLIGSLILFVPIFLVLNIFLSLNGTKIAVASSLVSIAVGIIYATMSKKLRKIETKENDKGYVFLHPEEFDLKELEEKEKTKEEIKKEGKKGSTYIVIAVILIYLAGQVGFPLYFFFASVGFSLLTRCFGVLLQIACAVVFFINMSGKNKEVRSHRFAFLAPFFAGIASAMTIVLLPVNDLYYYIVSIMALVAVIISAIELVKRYNELISRPIPQFKRKGGDDNA